MSSLSSFFVGLSGSFSLKSGVGVELIQLLAVGQRISLLDGVSSLVSLLSSDGSLDFVGVDDSTQIWVGDFVVRKNVSLFLFSGELVGSENVVEFLEGIFSPDDESSDVSSWGKLEKVESADVSDFNTWNVSQSLEKWDVLSAVDDQRSSSGSVSSVSLFSSSSSDLAGINNLLDISPSTDVLQESDGFSGSFNFFDSVVNDQWEFWDLINSVSSGLNQWEDSAGSQGGGNGISSLSEVGSSVPSSPDSEWSEHSSLSTHVTEGTLT